MRLLDAWAAMPEPERTARLRQMRACAWATLGQRADRLAVALQACEAGCPDAWQAADEIINAMPTLSVRKLLCELAKAQP